MPQYFTNGSINPRNFGNSFVQQSNDSVTDWRSQILTWLSPLEPKLRHGDIQERRVNNVGEWLMHTEGFRSWHDWSGGGAGGNAVLFCYGDPGVGKTFISSLVVDTLCDQAGERNTAVTCFYFDFAARNEQSAINILGSLVKQMVSGMERIPEEILRAFDEQQKVNGGPRPQLVDLVKMLQAITSSQPTFICIDGLDECSGVQQVRLLNSLRQILEKSPGTRIFVTGRPHIRAEVEKSLARRVSSISAGPTKGDIIAYLRFRLGEDEAPEAMDEDLEADILEKIPQNISKMFPLVSGNIEEILQESTIHQRRQRLRKITHGLGLGDAYGARIERIKAQGGDKSRLGMAALMWISHAERPLSADELCHALAVELGSTDFDAANVPSMSTLVGYCQGLITVDNDVSTVRLIHLTLHEYLSARPDIFHRPHSTMAEICLTYLNSEQVKAIPANWSHDTLDTPFLGYCSVYWGVHAKRELSDHAKSLALELLQQYDNHISAKFLLAQIVDLDPVNCGASFWFSGLHCASFLGIVDVVAALIETECCDINDEDFGGHTPLAWAAHNGHDEIVKMFLERGGVDPDKPDDIGRTPLFYAAQNGHEEVVKTILRQEEVNPDEPDNTGLTPLSLACWNGHEGVVQLLLGQEKVNPDKSDLGGRTPLSYAAQSGHEGVLKTLLGQKKLNPDKQDKYGKTPLSYSSREGHEGVVKLLLAQEVVDPDKPSDYGKTPLLYAAWSGHEEVVRILLAREVSPDKPDKDGRTPLLYAARKGHEGVVRILLEREINRNHPDINGQTPLTFAARYGHERVIALLQRREG